MINLYPHQQAAKAAVLGAVADGRQRGLIDMPTGTGKTFMFCAVAKELDRSTLVLCHRDELIRQTEGAFGQVWPGASVGVVKAERNETDRKVVLASVPSLRNGRLHSIAPDAFGLVVVDECHHSAADTWTAILEHFGGAFRLGVSATPTRLDGKGLAELFGDEPLFSYPLRQAIDDGHLSRLTQYQIRTTTKLDGVAYRCGDFAEGELSRAINTGDRNRCIVEAFQKHAADRRAIAFCVNVEHAEDLSEEFRNSNIVAASVTGNTPIDERRQLLSDFAAGNIRVMTNCQVLTEGFDDPAVDCVLMARPTASKGLYTQCIGRGLRKCPGKVDCIILDVIDNSTKHKLVNVLTLMGAPEVEDAGGADVIEIADIDIRRAEEAQEIASTKPLKWSLERVCPWPNLPSLKGYVASSWPNHWCHHPATDKQVRYLHRMGLDTSRPLTKGETCYLINRVQEFEAAYPMPPTSKQKWFLKNAGVWHENLTKREASKLIGELKRHARVA